MPLSIQIALGALVLAAGVFDFRSRRIPNWLNLSGVILGFGLNLFCFGWHGAVIAGEGLLFAAAVYLPLYLLRGMGAGDVKLMAAVGALVGPGHWLLIMITTALAGGAAAVVYALLKGRLTETCCNLYFLLKDLAFFRAPHKTNPQLDFRNASALRMPHGVIIAAASVAFLGLDFAAPLLVHRLTGL